MPIFRCESCDYSTSVKCNYAKHLLTEKHLSPKSINVHFHEPPIPDTTTSENQLSSYVCSDCGRKYKAQRSLWRHSKVCPITKPPNEKNPNNMNSSIYDKFASTVTELCKSNVELSKMNQLQQTQIHEMYNHFIASLQTQNAAIQNSVYSESNVTTNNILQSMTVNGNVMNHSL